ncbi:MAG: hypothetical protein JO352_25000 [Chloroflexi bacterium]|nr:hypothetical protein [Chloroflexota bacterium]MBV9602511.1 hypothetical protein [Chloroflexota bacterium]
MTETPHTPATTSGNDAGQAPGGQLQPGVNVQQLADKVYALLLADARLGRARGDSPLIAQRLGEG